MLSRYHRLSLRPEHYHWMCAEPPQVSSLPFHANSWPRPSVEVTQWSRIMRTIASLRGSVSAQYIFPKLIVFGNEGGGKCVCVCFIYFDRNSLGRGNKINNNKCEVCWPRPAQASMSSVYHLIEGTHTHSRYLESVHCLGGGEVIKGR